MGRTDPAKRTERRPQIIVVTRGQNTAAALPELRNALAIGFGQSVAAIHGEKPQFVKITKVQLTQDRVVTVGVGLAVPRRHRDQSVAIFVRERSQMSPQKGESFDVPIVFDKRDSRL